MSSSCLRAFVVAFVLIAAIGVRAADPPKTTKDDITNWMTALSNWGRWGKDDQRGTLNLITDEKRKQALKLVRDGVAHAQGTHSRRLVQSLLEMHFPCRVPLPVLGLASHLVLFQMVGMKNQHQRRDSYG